ncbi:MAG: hypothetical protein JSU04_01710 [Bdellovibrionales bacterium]|nr:hypothetical protein [Bdellovibrionales bacterium]
MVRIFAGLAVCSFVSLAQAQLCTQWSKPQEVGLLDTALLKEASGVAASRQFPNRLYHHNDSGAKGVFYVTDLNAQNIKEITYTYSQVTDVEDIAVGPCSSGQCVFLGDIGDNYRTRKSINLWIVPETQAFSNVSSTAKKIVLRYPDGPHNAESLAVHPVTGDVYILTKEDMSGREKYLPGKLYRLPKAALSQASATLKYLGEIDLHWMLQAKSKYGDIATGMDISPDGKTLLVLTYENAVEIKFDDMAKESFGTYKWDENIDYRIIQIDGLLSQQEGIGYSADGNSFYFDSEFNAKEGDTESPLYKVDCLKR